MEAVSALHSPVLSPNYQPETVLNCLFLNPLLTAAVSSLYFSVDNLCYFFPKILLCRIFWNYWLEFCSPVWCGCPVNWTPKTGRAKTGRRNLDARQLDACDSWTRATIGRWTHAACFEIISQYLK
jgi:hypothetical protein